MRTLKIIKYIFVIVGFGMLIGCFFTYKKTNEFLKTSIEANGTVVELLETKSENSSSITYKPEVQFKDKCGNLIQFVSSTSSNPPSYSIGEKVEVLYNPESSNDAKIKSFFSLWGGTIILGILGAVFLIVVGIIVLYNKRKSNLQKQLIQSGVKIEADYQRVVVNNSFSVNGRHPYQIISQWQNPTTKKLHIFTSDNIWFDPTNFIKTDKIEVLIDENNPKKYMVDLTFLPKLAK